MVHTPQRNIMSRLLADGIVLAAVLVWFAASQRLPYMILPDPLAVARRLGSLLIDEAFLLHATASFTRVISAVVIALVLGTILAIVQKSVPLLQYPINSGILPFFNSFPSIGWTILAAIWFQPGNVSIIFVEAVILLPFCLINISEGLENIDQEIVEMGNSFTTRRAAVLSYITLPLLLPYVSGALRISYGIGWKISLVAELIGSTSGLGYVMTRAESSADVATLLSCCLVVLLLYAGGDNFLIRPLTRVFEPPHRQDIQTRSNLQPATTGLI